jgi:hypothetical protein
MVVNRKQADSIVCYKKVYKDADFYGLPSNLGMALGGSAITMLVLALLLPWYMFLVFLLVLGSIYILLKFLVEKYGFYFWNKLLSYYTHDFTVVRKNRQVKNVIKEISEKN